MLGHKKTYFVEISVKDSSTEKLQEEINQLKAQIQDLNAELGYYRTRKAVDINDLRLALKSMKLHNVPENRIQRLEAFMQRLIEDPGS